MHISSGITFGIGLRKCKNETLFTCHQCDGVTGWAGTVSVASSDVEPVDHPTGQIRNLTGVVGGRAGGVIAFIPHCCHCVVVDNRFRVPRHPGRVGHTVQSTINSLGLAGNWNGKKHYKAQGNSLF